MEGEDRLPSADSGGASVGPGRPEAGLKAEEADRAGGQGGRFPGPAALLALLFPDALPSPLLDSRKRSATEGRIFSLLEIEKVSSFLEHKMSATEIMEIGK